MERWTFMVALAVVLVACGDDDDTPSESCGTACDGGSRDAAVSPVGAGGASAGAGGRGGSGAGGRGGSGGTTPAADASTDPDPTDSDAGAGPADAATADPDASTDPDSSVMPLPMTGDQLSVCDEPSDCDMGFGCYDVGPGQGFCTTVCEEDKDCKDLDGADYSCSDDGLCEVDCGRGPPGAEKCPEGLVCLQVSGPGPGGVRNRCKYSASAGTDGDAFSACSLPEDCDDGLQCVGALLTIPGYCTHACTAAAECSAKPSSGSIEPSCMADTCVLSCAGNADGCPTGMACIETPLFSQCTYE
jgi:hypothetical protein